jgi:DNA-binding transcriptional MocR family regulator
LNFSNATPERIDEGVRRLARCLDALISGHAA